LSQQVIRYERLEGQQQRALTALSFADNRFLAAKGDLEAVGRMVVEISEPRPLPRLSNVIRGVVAVTGIAVLLAAGLVALLEFLRPTRAPVAAKVEGRGFL
jgi:hypothetical protein